METSFWKLIFLLVFITILQSILVDAAQDVNCTRNVHTHDLKNTGHCCPIPKLASGDIRAKCLQKRHERWHSVPFHLRQRRYRYRNRRQYYRHKRGYFKQMYWSCVLNETGIIKNGKLQEANLTEYLHKITDNVQIIPVIEQAFEYCIDFNYTNVNSTHDHHHRHPRNHHHHIHHNHHHRRRPHHHNRCHDPQTDCGHHLSVNETNARRLILCVFQETFVNCPNESWNNTEFCNAKREYIHKCRLHNALLPIPNPQPVPEEDDHEDTIDFMGEENDEKILEEDAGININELDSEFETFNEQKGARTENIIAANYMDLRGDW